MGERSYCIGKAAHMQVAAERQASATRKYDHVVVYSVARSSVRAESKRQPCPLVSHQRWPPAGVGSAEPGAAGLLRRQIP